MIVEKISVSRSYKKRYHIHNGTKTRKICIYTQEKGPLTLEQEDKIQKFFESL
jgi:hypothetical protein